jgi:hypothetical protein
MFNIKKIIKIELLVTIIWKTIEKRIRVRIARLVEIIQKFYNKILKLLVLVHRLILRRKFLFIEAKVKIKNIPHKNSEIRNLISIKLIKIKLIDLIQII